MKRLIFMLSISLFGLMGTDNTYAGVREDAIALVDESLVLVRRVCSYTIVARQGAEVKEPVTIVELGAAGGTGFFVDKPMLEPNQYAVFTAGHVPDCAYDGFSGLLKKYRFSGKVSSLELKTSLTRLEVFYKDTWYPAKAIDVRDENVYPDFGYLILTTILPEEIRPYKIPYGLKRGKDYTVASRVLFSGYMGVGDGWLKVLDEALIQEMDTNSFRISLAACPGMSGSPILFWKNNRYYAIGVVSAGMFLGSNPSVFACGDSIKSAIITDLDFLNNESQKKP